MIGERDIMLNDDSISLWITLDSQMVDFYKDGLNGTPRSILYPH